MPPDTAERRPVGKGAAPDGVHGKQDEAIVTAHVTGCPCGCMTRLPWFDDPDCIRHRPIPARVLDCPGQFGPSGRWERCCRGDAA